MKPVRSSPRGGTRVWLIGVLSLVVALAVAIPVLANLSGTTFDAGDGNLVVNGGETDWANAPNFVKRLDLPTGSGDDSFGNGTKEDSAVPSVIDGSIPNNKSDLTRFYAATENANGDDYFYFAWERVQEPNGTTNMDIELNQSDVLSANGKTPVRTSGDILFTYDLAQGGTHPVLHYRVWGGSAWGSEQNLGGNFEASINDPTNDSTPTVDPIAPDNPRTLSFRTFGEAAVNLTDAGLVTAGGCNGFASAYLKSRSSDSFSSAVKDFILPTHINLNNCEPAVIKLKKKDASGNPLSGAVMQLFKDNDTSGTINAGDTQVAPDGWVSGTKNCTTTSNGIGNCVFTLAGATASNGQYIGHEVTPPNGFTTSAPDVVQVVTIGASAQEFILQFTDNLAPGTVKVHKQDDAGNPLLGVTFKLFTDNGSGATAGPPDGAGSHQDQHGIEDTDTGLSCVTNAAGNCDITQVPGNTKYWVVEVPPNPFEYDVAPDLYADVGAGSTPGQGATVDLTGTPFVDPRKHRVIVIVCHQGTNTLAAASVALNGDNAGAKNTVTSDTDATALCAKTTGANFPNRKHTAANGNTPDALAVTINGAANGTHP